MVAGLVSHIHTLGGRPTADTHVYIQLRCSSQTPPGGKETKGDRLLYNSLLSENNEGLFGSVLLSTTTQARGYLATQGPQP